MELLFINLFYLICIFIVIHFFYKKGKYPVEKYININLFMSYLDHLIILYKLNRNVEADNSLEFILNELSNLIELGYLNFNESEKISNKIFEIRELLITLNSLTKKNDSLIKLNTKKWKKHYQTK